MKKSHLLAGSSGGGVGSVPRGGAEDYAPVDWSLYFDVSRKIQIPNSDDVFRTFEIGTVAAPKPLVVLHHGGGHSALSWALCARALADLSKNSFSILAFDCRGHGRTKTINDGDLSLQTLSQDMVNLIRTMYGDAIIPPIFLVGHSMGGAIVVHVASQKMLRVQGLAVLDVVEGTAMEALEGPAMMQFLGSRPPVFRSYSEAIYWSYQTDTVRNLESARVSLPPQLRRIQNPRKPLTPEEEENDKGEPAPGKEYTWRTNLFASEQYWRGWYTGMSSKFLQTPAAKLLVLAGTDRLDKDLTIGQMQGKFQMKVLPAVGHIVQEDAPKQVAQVIYEFVERNQPLDINAIRAKNPPPVVKN